MNIFSNRLDKNLALLLASKIQLEYKEFSEDCFVAQIEESIHSLSYKQRIALFAHTLYAYCPKKYSKTLSIFYRILGTENLRDTGMYTLWYWLSPIAYFIEHYGISEMDYFDDSMLILLEITKRHTSEFAIRPFLEKVPEQVFAYYKDWVHSKNFHVRRLVSESLRPRLPWAKKLGIFHNHLEEIIYFLDILKNDSSKFVRRSVANCMRDLKKEVPEQIQPCLESWKNSTDPRVQQVLRHIFR